MSGDNGASGNGLTVLQRVAENSAEFENSPKEEFGSEDSQYFRRELRVVHCFDFERFRAASDRSSQGLDREDPHSDHE